MPKKIKLIIDTMKSLKSFLFGFTIIVSIVGCSITSGRMISYKENGMMEVGKTTLSETINLFSQPTSIQTKSTKDGTFTIMTYQGTHVADKYSLRSPSHTRHTSHRIGTHAITSEGTLLHLEFKNGILNGKIYVGISHDNFDDFNYENYKKIKIGTSNKQDVINLLGNPNAFLNCPSTLGNLCENCRGASLALSYVYERNDPFKEKKIVISFDENGTVCYLNLSIYPDNID
jgi:hypothetical protein